MMRCLLIFFMVLPTFSFAQECVVLLHGYRRTSKCLLPLETILTSAGYVVQNITYPTTKYSIETITKEYVAPQIQNISCEKIHFIGHSMGGIVIRKYLSEYRQDNLGKVILIASPNNGSELVSTVYKVPWASRILGPAVMDLARGSEFIHTLPKPYYRVGIITASSSRNPIISLLLDKGKNDGLVSVSSMLLDNEDDVVDINTTHNRILIDPLLGRYVQNFLKYGLFIDL
jgi:triacylglycerol lipase